MLKKVKQGFHKVGYSMMISKHLKGEFASNKRKQFLFVYIGEKGSIGEMNQKASENQGKFKN